MTGAAARREEKNERSQDHRKEESQQRDREKNDTISKENDHLLEMTNETTGQRTTKEGRKNWGHGVISVDANNWRTSIRLFFSKLSRSTMTS
jgi:hypothetical protein